MASLKASGGRWGGRQLQNNRIVSCQPGCTVEDLSSTWAFPQQNNNCNWPPAALSARSSAPSCWPLSMVLICK
ncbi:hypothetical protein EYF80_044013 [Liparis tanakae]|uniref:Uncharacterized protein n=1 Tax=Liparis tanakae TaxID=230148 RepID=A0A4Z2FYM1_9TELE|nr:hypothetical protein EYF80_044013 [Liparis tanakae]